MENCLLITDLQRSLHCFGSSLWAEHMMLVRKQLLSPERDACSIRAWSHEGGFFYVVEINILFFFTLWDTKNVIPKSNQLSVTNVLLINYRWMKINKNWESFVKFRVKWTNIRNEACYPIGKVIFFLASNWTWFVNVYSTLPLCPTCLKCRPTQRCLPS